MDGSQCIMACLAAYEQVNPDPLVPCMQENHSNKHPKGLYSDV